MVQEPIFRRAAAVGQPRGCCLNAGSGEGLYSEFLESYAGIREIVNVDLGTPRIAARRADPRHRDLVGSLTELPLAGESVDWVICTEVLEFIEDDRRAVRELGRVLKPGAYALLSVPTPPVPRVSDDVREGYTLAQLRVLLADAGLEIVWEAHCFHLFMRWCVVLWRWQYEVLGGGRKNLMPRALLLAFAYGDRWLRLGRPWDLVVLARRR